MTGRAPSASGFSLVELTVALAISTLVTAAVFAMLDPANGAFQIQPESADVAQRLRAAAEAIARDVRGGGGAALPQAYSSGQAQAAAAFFPFRIGRRGADLPGSFDDTRLSFWQASTTGPQAVLGSALASASGSASIVAGPWCVSGAASCGFQVGMAVAALSHSGIVDLFTVTGVGGAVLTLQHNQSDSARVYPPGQTTIAAVTVRTYFFRRDPITGVGQLRRYDGDNGADVPVVDHVEGLSFELYGEADPPQVVAGSVPPRSTYGLEPPAVSTQLTAYPPGENCAFTRTASGGLAARLPLLSSATTLVPLTRAVLTDGPWCPDDLSPIRYDADLLRVRQVVAVLRVEASSDAFRGPAGMLFARAGSSRRGRWVPDRQVRIVIAPGGVGGRL